MCILLCALVACAEEPLNKSEVEAALASTDSKILLSVVKRGMRQLDTLDPYSLVALGLIAEKTDDIVSSTIFSLVARIRYEIDTIYYTIKDEKAGFIQETIIRQNAELDTRLFTQVEDNPDLFIKVIKSFKKFDPIIGNSYQPSWQYMSEPDYDSYIKKFADQKSLYINGMEGQYKLMTHAEYQVLKKEFESMDRSDPYYRKREISIEDEMYAIEKKLGAKGMGTLIVESRTWD